MGLSQRALAQKAGIAYKTLQLIEGGSHNPEWGTLLRLSTALGYSQSELQKKIQSCFYQEEVFGLKWLAQRIIADGFDSWKVHLFDFIDQYRREGFALSYDALMESLPEKLQALSFSVVETLLDEKNLEHPFWLNASVPLPKPWFPAGVHNLMPFALVESPIHFRKRNIFVLENFLARV